MNRNIWELANELCRAVQKKRLDRIGEPMPEIDGPALDYLPRSERQTWVDVAQSILEFGERDGELPSELRRLADDWARYGELCADPETRDDMRRAVVVELRVCIEKMWKDCGGDRP